MKWFIRVIVFGSIAGLITFASFWISLPSISEFRQLALTRPLYCATFVDRNGILLQPMYSLPGQSEYVHLDSLGWFVRGDLTFFEDRTFYSWFNFGFNIKGLGRAILIKLGLKSGRSGGSGLYQQLYRIVTGHKVESLFRKSMELVGAIKLWCSLTKDEVIELYLNNAYFGAGSKLGIASAAQRFFSKRPEDLNRSEFLMLISFLNLPPASRITDFEPIYRKYHDRVRRLIEARRLSSYEEDYHDILSGPEFNISSIQATSFGVFIDRALDETKMILSGSNWSIEFDGLTVETTLDRALNDSLASILNNHLQRLKDARGSFVMLDQENEVRAYLSKGYSLPGNFDDLQSDQVMPASRFKVLSYAVVIEMLISKGIHAQSDILNFNLPTTYKVSERFTVRDSGPARVPLREAISESKNAPAYYVGNKIVTPELIVEFARNFGSLHLVPYPSIVLGTQGFSELKLCWAYSTLLVRNGFLKRPSFVRRILTRVGEVIYDATTTNSDAREPQIVSTKTCKILRQALRESVEEGTSKQLKEISILGHDVAAKTGTARHNFHLGLTAVVDHHTFSLLLQSKNFSDPASKIVVPIAGEMLMSAKLMGRL